MSRHSDDLEGTRRCTKKKRNSTTHEARVLQASGIQAQNIHTCQSELDNAWISLAKKKTGREIHHNKISHVTFCFLDKVCGG